MTRVALLVLVAGCSNILGIGDLKGPGSHGDGGTTDTPQGGSDASGDGPLGMTIRVSGRVTAVDANLGMQPVTNAPIEFIRTPDEVSIASGGTDSTGSYTLVVPVSGVGAVGYVRAHGNMLANTNDSLRYPPKPLTADTVLDVQLYSNNTITTFAQLGGTQQPSGLAFGIAVVETATGGPLPGATVSSQPAAQVRYTNNQGLPSPTITSTGGNGVAMLFGLQIAPAMFTASQGGGMVFATQQIRIGTTATYLFELQP